MDVTKQELNAQPVFMWGDLPDGSLVIELIGLLQQNRRTAALTVTRGQTQKTLFFHDGMVHSASSNLPEDRLGSLMLHSGQIDRKTLQEALKQTGPGRKLGNVLIDMEILTPADLWDLIRLQIEEICYSMVLFDQGEFTVGGYALDELPVQAGIPGDKLLLDVMRRQDELRDAVSNLPPMSSVLVRCNEQPINLNAAEHTLFGLVDGKRTIDQLFHDCDLSHINAAMALYRMIRSQIIAPSL